MAMTVTCITEKGECQTIQIRRMTPLQVAMIPTPVWSPPLTRVRVSLVTIHHQDQASKGKRKRHARLAGGSMTLGLHTLVHLLLPIPTMTGGKRVLTILEDAHQGFQNLGRPCRQTPIWILMTNIRTFSYDMHRVLAPRKHLVPCANGWATVCANYAA